MADYTQTTEQDKVKAMASSMRNDMRPLPVPEEDFVVGIEDPTLNLGHAGLESECWSDAAQIGFYTSNNLMTLRSQQPDKEYRDLMPYIGSVLAGRAGRGVRSHPLRPSNWTPDVLSGREGEILGLVGNGLSNKRIALALGIAPETVKWHVKKIFLKLEVRTRAEAVSRATALYLMRRGGEHRAAPT
jgi:DNA-binding CsgD family transcriptional regulator